MKPRQHVVTNSESNITKSATPLKFITNLVSSPLQADAVDISYALHLVPLIMLLHAVSAVEFPGGYRSLFYDYLTDNPRSMFQEVFYCRLKQSSVPQGYTLGTMFLSAYDNDFCDVVNCFRYLHFANINIHLSLALLKFAVYYSLALNLY